MRNQTPSVSYTLILCFVVFTAATKPAHASHSSSSLSLSNLFAFWVWTPETNQWTNPKYSVKDTPKEQLEVGLGFYESEEYEEAIREFRKLIKHYPRAREAPDAQYHIGLSLEKQDKIFAAFKEYQTVIDKYPFSELAVVIVQKQYDIGMMLLDNASNRGKFMEAFAGANYDVIDVFKAVIKNAPYGELAPPAQYKIGLYLQEKGLYQEARDEFEKVINDYPESEWSKAARYQIAEVDAQRSTPAQYDQKITQSAVNEFKKFVENYPDAELSSSAKEQIRKLKEKEAENSYVIGEFYEKQKNYKAAKIYYQVVVDEYQSSSWAPKSLKKIREIAEKEK